MNTAAVPGLLHALDSDDEIIVTRAASCLGNMQVEASESTPKLEAAWDSVTSDAAKQAELRNLQRVARQHIERLNQVQN